MPIWWCVRAGPPNSDLHCESAEAAKLKVVGPFCSSTPKLIVYNKSVKDLLLKLKTSLCSFMKTSNYFTNYLTSIMTNAGSSRSQNREIKCYQKQIVKAVRLFKLVYLNLDWLVTFSVFPTYFNDWSWRFMRRWSQIRKAQVRFMHVQHPNTGRIASEVDVHGPHVQTQTLLP